MSYLWQEFNIKTFEAETLVFRDGVFCPELSEYQSAEFDNIRNIISVNKISKLPVHIIYFGEIAGNIDLNININIEKARVFMTLKTFNKKPAFLNIFIKNTGKNSVFDGKIIIKNNNILKINEKCRHLSENTGIFLKNKILAYNGSETILTGQAEIEKNSPDCDSDISFSVMAEDKVVVKLQPIQYINSVPKSASHSASLYKPNNHQINYLRSAGLSGKEIKQILEEAFLE